MRVTVPFVGPPRSLVSSGGKRALGRLTNLALVECHCLFSVIPVNRTWSRREASSSALGQLLSSGGREGLTALRGRVRAEGFPADAH